MARGQEATAEAEGKGGTTTKTETNETTNTVVLRKRKGDGGAMERVGSQGEQSDTQHMRWDDREYEGSKVIASNATYGKAVTKMSTAVEAGETAAEGGGTAATNDRSTCETRAVHGDAATEVATATLPSNTTKSTATAAHFRIMRRGGRMDTETMRRAKRHPQNMSKQFNN